MELFNSEYLKKTIDPTLPSKTKSYDWMDLSQKNKVLDLGCGNGFDVLEMSKKLPQSGMAYGLDINPEFIEVAQKLKAEHNIKNATFLVGKAEQLPFKDRELDAVRVERVFQHLPNNNEVLLEIKRVLKPGGSLVILETDWRGLSFFSPHQETPAKLVDFLVQKRLNNGLASRTIVTSLAKHNFSDIKFEISPIAIPQFEAADMFIHLSDLAKMAFDKGVLNLEAFEEWKEEVLALEQITNTIGLVHMFAIKATV